MKTSFSTFLIKNTKVSFLFGLAIVVMGLFATLVIPKESAPNIEFGVVNITTVYSGVSATDIDSLVTQKIESKISAITSIKKYTSSSSSGISNITAEFRPGVNMVKAVSDVRSKVDEAKNELPSDLDSDPIITEIDSSLTPFLQVILFGEYPAHELSIVAEKLKIDLESLPGVAKVSLSGNQDTEIQVRIDKQKIESLGILIPQVQNAIRSAHSDVPIGDIQINNLEYTLRFQGKLKTLDDVKNVSIANIGTQSSPKIIFLKDIAVVKESGKSDSDIISRYGKIGSKSENAVTLSISRTGGQDIFAADQGVRDAVEEFSKQSFLPGMEYDYAAEGVVRMNDDFSNLFQNAGTSVLLVLILLFLFIGLREGLVASLVIPLSFLSTIAVLFFLGKSLNFMTNFAMILALGILVDTAIVMVEGSHHYIQKGMDPKQAALKSFEEFRAPLVSGMATTVVVFLPLFFLPDIMGKYLSYIPVTVTIVLLAALFISLFLITSYSGVLLKKKKLHDPSENYIEKKSILKSFRGKIDASFARGINFYKEILLFIIPSRKKKWGMFFIVMLLFFGSFQIPVKFEMFPSADGGSLSISFEKPVGTDVLSTLEPAKILEDEILTYPEVKKVKTLITKNNAEIYVELLTIDERAKKNMRTAKELEEILNTRFQEISKESVQIQGEAKGPPSSSPVGFRVVMKDIEYLDDAKKVTESLTQIVKKEAGTQGVRNTISEIPGEFRFSINREKALKLGINPDSIASMVRTALYGSSVATITREKQDIDIRVQLSEDDIGSIEDVQNFIIAPNIPLSSVVTITKEVALSDISRYDGKLMFKVSAFLTKEGNASEITASVLAKLEAGALPLPNGVSIEDASENADNAALMSSLLGSGIMAIIMIFIILVVQFNSFSQPLLILQTILFAQIGVSLGLYITDTPRSLAFILGVISLAGIVVNDAIIMVDKMNRNIASGEFVDKFNAIASAGASRFIPVVLTTLTTSAGILPLIFVDAFWAGLSYTIFFGLMVSTFLTLFLIPVGYTLFWPPRGKMKD